MRREQELVTLLLQQKPRSREWRWGAGAGTEDHLLETRAQQTGAPLARPNPTLPRMLESVFYICKKRVGKELKYYS